MAPIKSGLIEDEEVVVTQQDLAPPPAPVPQPAPPTPEAGGTYDEVVAEQLGSTWVAQPDSPSGSVGITEYDQGPAIQTYGYAEPAPPPEPTPQEYFGGQASGTIGITAQDQGPSVQTYGYAEPGLGVQSPVYEYRPEVQSTYVSAEDYFGGMYDGLGPAPEDPGELPAPGAGTFLEGWGFFGTPEEQQQQWDWWNQDYNKALEAGDEEAIRQLNLQADTAIQAWQDYEARAAEWQAKAAPWNEYVNAVGEIDAKVNDAYRFTPQGEGGFTRIGLPSPAVGAALGDPDLQIPTLVSNEDLRAYYDSIGYVEKGYTPDGQIMLRSDIQRQIKQQEFAESLAQIDAEPAILSSPEARDALTQNTRRQWDIAAEQGARRTRPFEGTVYNNRIEGPNFYGEAPETPLGFQVVGQALGAASRVSLDNPLIQGIPGVPGATAALRATNSEIDTLGEAVIQGAYIAGYLGIKGNQLASYTSSAFGYGLGYVGVDRKAQRAREDGVGLVGFMRQEYDAQGALQRFVGEVAFDPFTWIPFGALVGRGAQAARTANRLRTVQQVTRAALTTDELRFIATNATTGEWGAIKRITDSVMAEMGGHSLLDQAVATRIATKALVERKAGTEITAAWIEREIAGHIGAMADQLPGTAAEVAAVKQRLGLAQDVVLKTVNNPPPAPPAPVVVAAERRAAQSANVPNTSATDVPNTPPPPTPAGLPKADDWMERNPDSFRRDYSIDDWDHADELLVTERQLRVMEEQGAKSRVVPWQHPLEQLEALPQAERTMERAAQIMEASPPTEFQARTATKLRQGENITSAELTNIKKGRVTAREAYDIIERGFAKVDARKPGGAVDRAVELRGRGHDVDLDPRAPSFGERLVAAEQNDIYRGQVGEEISGLLPVRERAVRAPGLTAKVASGAKVVGDVDVLTPFRFREMILANFDTIADSLPEMKVRLFNMIHEPSRLYIGVTGAPHEGAASETFWALLRDFREDIAKRVYTSEELDTFYRILADEYDDATLTKVARQKQAEDVLARMSPEERAERLANVERKMAENADLEQELAGINRRLRNGEKTRELQQARERARSTIQQNTSYIHKTHPDYRPEVAKRSPKAKAAANDAKLKAAGLPVEPTSDPSLGFDRTKLASDSTNDTLVDVMDPPEGAAEHTVVFAPLSADMAVGMRRSSIRGNEILQRVNVDEIQPSNPVYESKVAEYAARDDAQYISLDRSTAGGYIVHNGNHRFEAARRRGAKSILAWVPESTTSFVSPRGENNLARGLNVYGDPLSPREINEMRASMRIWADQIVHPPYSHIRYDNPITPFSLPESVREEAQFFGIPINDTDTVATFAQRVLDAMDPPAGVATRTAVFAPKQTNVGAIPTDAAGKMLDEGVFHDESQMLRDYADFVAEQGAVRMADIPPSINEMMQRHGVITWEWDNVGGDLQAKRIREAVSDNEAAFDRRFYTQQDIKDELRAGSQGLGRGSNFRFKTPEEVSDAAGNMMSQMNALERRGKKVPQWMHDRLMYLDRRAQHWRDTGQDTYDRILPTWSVKWLNRRPIPAQIDLAADMWANVDWADPDTAARITKIVDAQYDYADLAKATPDPSGRFSAELASQITRTSDMTENWLRGRLGEAMGQDDPEGFLQSLVKDILDPKTSVDEIAKRDKFFATKDGLEVLRTIRRHGPKILDNWYALDPYPSVGKLSEIGVLQVPQNGRLDFTALDKLQTWVHSTTYPTNTNRVMKDYIDTTRSVLRERWGDFTANYRDPATGEWLVKDIGPQQVEVLDQAWTDAQAALRQATDDKRRLQEMAKRIKGSGQKVPKDLADQIATAEADEIAARRANDAAATAAKDAKRLAAQNRGIHISDINRHLFPDTAELPYDHVAKSKLIASYVAKEEATRLGFDPDAMDPALKIMAVVKGNLAPLWMTINPSYTINNAAGNWSAMLLGALHSGMHGGLLPKTSGAFKDARNEVGSGIDNIAYLETHLTHMTEDVTGGLRPEQNRFIPKLIHGGFDPSTKKTTLGKINEGFWSIPGTMLNPGNVVNKRWGTELARRMSADEATKGYEWGLGGWHGFLSDLNDGIERSFKTAVFSKEFMWTYRETLTKELRTLGLHDNADIASAVGMKQMRLALEKHAIEKATADRVMRSTRYAIDMGKLKGYDTTATMLRDYRMRNKLDGFLDHIVPIHYWTTKNLLFVGKVAANRPGVALAAMKGLDAWRDSNADLPFSLQLGLIPIPGSVIPFANDDRPYYFRVSNGMNPAIFALPEFASRFSTGSGTLGDRVRATAMSVFGNGWEEMGYRAGPQFDAIHRLYSLALGATGKRDNRWAAMIESGLRFLVSPSGYRTELVPFSSQLFSRSEKARTLELFGIGLGIEAINTAVYGYAYTRMDVAAFNREIENWKRTGKLGEDPQKAQEEANRLYLLLADSQINRDIKALQNDPTMQAIIGQVLRDNADNNIRAKMGLSGREYDAQWEMTTKVGEEYGRLLDAGDPRQAQAWARQNMDRWKPYFSQWLDLEVAAGRLDRDEANAVLAEMTHPIKGGNLDNDLFQQAVEDARSAREKHGKGASEDALNLTYGMIVAAKAYEDLVRESGREKANAYVREHAPEVYAYWMANDAPEKVRQRIMEDNAWKASSEAYDAARNHYDDIYGGRDEFYTRLDNIARSFDIERQRTTDPADLALLDRSERQMKARVYDDAEAAGKPILSQHLLPMRGREFREITPDMRRFIEANGGEREMAALQEHDTAKAQRGWLLDLVASTLGLDRSSEQFKTDGRFDATLWDAAVAEAADKAPALYRELADNLSKVTASGYDRPNAGGLVVEALRDITPADFTHHLRDSYPNEDRLQRDLAAYNRMDSGAEKDAKRQEIESTYGTDIFDRWYDGKVYEATENADGTITTGTEHAIYGEATREFGGIDTLYQQFSPRQKAEFKEQYPDAFEKATGTDEDGREYEFDKLIATNMTTEQVKQVLRDYGIQPDGTPLGTAIEDLGLTVPTQDTTTAADAELAREKQSEYYNLLTPEEQIALDRYYAVRDDPRFQEAKAIADNNPTKKGKPGWWAAKEAGYADIVNKYFELVDLAGPAFDKRDAWWAEQDETTQQILVAEGTAFARYADQIGAGDGGETTPADTGTSDAGSSGAADAPSGSTSNYVPYEDYARTKTGYGGSSRSTARSTTTRSTSGSTSGGYTPRPASGGFGGGGSASAPADTADPFGLTPLLMTLDPFLATGDDDGRSEIVGQVSTYLSQMLAPLSFLPPQMQKTLIGMLVPWFKSQLGTNPDLAAWLRLLDRLRGIQNTQQPDQATAPETAAAAGTVTAPTENVPLPPPPTYGYQA